MRTIVREKQFLKVSLKLFLVLGIIFTTLNAQEKIISGKVMDDVGEPLPDVDIILKGGNQEFKTDLEGNYSLQVPDEKSILLFQYIGFTDQEIIVGNKTIINIEMKEDSESLGEVVFIGYGTQNKDDVTGAVSSVNMDEIQKLPTSDVATALQGQVAGVNVSTSSGAPGSSPVVRVRGLGTIGDNDPLYVIDGIPGDLSYINPADIESMSVLRDASAATIYGSRASNGVVIVTTKRGKIGEPRVTFNSFMGVHSMLDNVDVANRSQYNQIMREARANAGETPLNYTLDDSQYANSDWMDAYTKTGTEQKYDVGISGGSEKMNYNFSGGYYKNDGTVINTGLERFSTRLNLDFKLFNDYLKVSPGIAFTRDNIKNIRETLGEGNAGFSPFLSVLTALPHNAIYDSSSSNGFAAPEVALGTGNPVGQRELERNRNQDDYIQFNIATELKLYEGLTYQMQYGMNVEEKFNSFFVPAYSFGQAIIEDPYLSEERSRLNSWTFNNVLNYKNSFGNHNLDALVGISKEENEYRSTYGSNTALASDKLDALNGGTGDQASGGYNFTNTLQSYFGRVSYDFDNKYFLQTTFRRDGSSRFGPDNKYGNFYSVSVGWAMHKEDFINSDIFSQLKPRFSYGTLGNQNIGNHRYLARIGLGGSQLNYPFGESVSIGASATSLPAPDVKWEETATANFGLDLGFIQNKFQFTFDYFSSKTKDMLVEIPIPASSGITEAPFTNGGEMKNKGWELSAIYRKKGGDFTFDIMANVSASKNEITKLGFTDADFVDGYVEFENFPTTRTVVGGEIGRFYLYQTDGIFQNQAEIDAHGVQANAAPGDLKFVDTNGDGELNDDDKVFYDSGLPKFEYGLTFNAAYKNFDFTLFFQGTEGNKMYNGAKMWLYRTDRVENVSSDLVNAWSLDNPTSNIPRNVSSDPNKNTRESDYYLEDASYLRLKNLQIGYTLPKDITNKYAISRARIYCSATNVLTISDYSGFDPALSNSGLFSRGVDRGFYPLTQSYVMGINLTF